MSHHATAKRRARRIVGAALGTLALAGGAVTAAQAQNLPVTSGDPRIGLSAGLENAGSVALGLQHLANRPKPAAVSGTNSDLAFQGDYAFAGNYNGINIYNVADPANPTLVTLDRLPGQPERRIRLGNLLFVSVEATPAKKDCSTTPAADATTRFRGIRIFDICDISSPVQLGRRPDLPRLAHAHARRPRTTRTTSTSTSRARGRPAATRDRRLRRRLRDRANPSLWRIEVIKVPLAAPKTAAVVSEPRLFKHEATGAVNGLQNAPTQPQHPSGDELRGPTPTPTRATTSPSTRSSTSRPAPARATAC